MNKSKITGHVSCLPIETTLLKLKFESAFDIFHIKMETVNLLVVRPEKDEWTSRHHYHSSMPLNSRCLTIVSTDTKEKLILPFPVFKKSFLKAVDIRIRIFMSTYLDLQIIVILEISKFSSFRVATLMATKWCQNTYDGSGEFWKCKFSTIIQMPNSKMILMLHLFWWILGIRFERSPFEMINCVI